MSEVHDVEGYAVCGCGAWVLNEVAARTGGQCGDCFSSNPHLRVVELVNRGRRMEISLRKHQPRKRERSAERRAKVKLNEKARHLARKRLAAIFPDVFDQLLAEERARLGLDPWPIQLALQPGRSVTGGDEEIEFARLLAELEQIGADTR